MRLKNKMVANYLKKKKEEKDSNAIEFKKLEKENIKIRNKLDLILKEYLSTIDDNYGDLWGLIEILIDNEIEQEGYCNI